jgi:hypothetical protein
MNGCGERSPVMMVDAETSEGDEQSGKRKE